MIISELWTGRLLGTWTDNNVTSYRYDALGRLEFVDVTKLSGVTLAVTQTTSYGYDNVGNLKTETLPTGETARTLTTI